MKVFFYGLFMDANVLATKGIMPAQAEPGSVDGFDLRIGDRATLVPEPGKRAWGIVMEIEPGDVTHLYSEASVADYLPEPVTVELLAGGRADATCYNLPPGRVTGTNRQYAAALLELAERLGFPDAYLDQIRQA